ncbi:hypothetical protein CLOM_g12045 [Closterium sp. NIES-68]|nr:hypothetical protein CLOM_g12045 [Closterium sp. NIES-68]
MWGGAGRAAGAAGAARAAAGAAAAGGRSPVRAASGGHGAAHSAHGGARGFFRGMGTVVAGMLPGRIIYMTVLEAVKANTLKGLTA